MSPSGLLFLLAGVIDSLFPLLLDPEDLRPFVGVPTAPSRLRFLSPVSLLDLSTTFGVCSVVMRCALFMEPPLVLSLEGGVAFTSTGLLALEASLLKCSISTEVLVGDATGEHIGETLGESSKPSSSGAWTDWICLGLVSGAVLQFPTALMSAHLTTSLWQKITK